MDEALAGYQARLADLVAQRQGVWADIRAKLDGIDQQERARRNALQADRSVRENVIDAQIDALYREATRRAGIHEGDVVRIAHTYGDAKKGAYAFANKVWHDTDRQTDMITISQSGGGMVLPLETVYLVIDPDEADKFRFTMLCDYVEFAAGSDLLKRIDAIRAHLDTWAARLRNQEAADDTP